MVISVETTLAHPRRGFIELEETVAVIYGDMGLPGGKTTLATAFWFDNLRQLRIEEEDLSAGHVRRVASPKPQVPPQNLSGRRAAPCPLLPPGNLS